MILATCKKVVVDIKFGLNESECQRFLINIKPPKASSKGAQGYFCLANIAKSNIETAVPKT